MCIRDREYVEGIYVGYRYFDTFGKEVSYPFGYGLSYTDFSTEIVDVEADADYVTVTAKVTNTGDTLSLIHICSGSWDRENLSVSNREDSPLAYGGCIKVLYKMKEIDI